MEDILKDILAAFSVVLNGLPQGLLALSFGFASVPTALAFLVGAAGNSSYRLHACLLIELFRKNVIRFSVLIEKKGMGT